MSTYFRVMSGRSTTSPFSRRFVIALVALIVAVSVAIDAGTVWQTIRSPAGAAAVVAMVAGLCLRRLMALTPWYLLTVALGLDVLLPVVVGNLALVLSLAQYTLVAAAFVIAIVQVKVELSGRRDHAEGPLVAWGSAMVAVPILILAITSRLTSLPGQ